MPSTIVTEEIELIHSGKGPGGGGFSGDGGEGGDGADSSGASSVPQRAYVTGMFIALAGILMFFMAFVSAYIVRKDMPNSSWVPLQVPRILWLNTLILIASSFTLARAHNRFAAKDDEGFPSLVGHHHGPRNSFRRRPDSGLAAARRSGNFPRQQSEQQLFLRFHRRARFALAGRNSGAALRAIPRHSKGFKGHRDRSRLDVLAFYGWPVGLLVSTPLPGKVKRE